MIDRLEAEGRPTPLDVMLTAMDAALARGEEDRAIAIAKIAAPYMHPKLKETSVETEHRNFVGMAEQMERARERRLADERPRLPELARNPMRYEPA
jgi:hypothetical protein